MSGVKDYSNDQILDIITSIERGEQSWDPDEMEEQGDRYHDALEEAKKRGIDIPKDPRGIRR